MKQAIGLKIVDDFNMKFFETSAKTNQNINEIFGYLAQKFFKAKQACTFDVKYETKKEEPKKHNDSNYYII